MSLSLLPNTFYDEQPIDAFVPPAVPELLQRLDGIIGESERATRRYLIKVLRGSEKARSIPIELLNEHSKSSDVQTLAHTIVKGGTWALLSDAGISCVADPGSSLILQLHRMGYYDVFSLGTPSSILMALQLSGLSGQQFTFHGYLPQEKEARLSAIRRSEKDLTQLVIETPYRNGFLLQDLIDTLLPTTLLCVAEEVGCPEQRVRTYPVSYWKKTNFETRKVPTVFLWQKNV